ncbi:helix-turn-helix domain-containing protein [Paenibacillus mendelii]|uniref:Helix-turn-helix domain-containing protein n=1 Tax=Paenibacillus mendelii TaxID=206163 RepID=A0ABV6J7N5_9BACL|nr:helix-turn-helix domain-containing protein [Paenibacillus mendelii]MCQ6560472.1 AraC family transcriptional regulator [Paenibacillus mendelii]
MIKKFILKNPFQLFLTILLPFLLSTLLVIFVQFSFQGRIFEKFALEMVYNQQQTDLQNTSRNVSLMEQSANSVATSAFFDEGIQDLLYSDVHSEDYRKYQRKLELYKNLYPFLQSIYIYNGHNIHSVPSMDFVSDRSTFDDKGIFTILDDIQNNRTHSIVLRKIPNPLADLSTNASDYIYVYSYLFFDSQVQSGKVSEAIVLNISEEWVRQSIGSSDDKINRIFMIDRNGILLSSDSIHPLQSDLKDKDYIQMIHASAESSGNLRIDVDGVDSFVTYAATDVFGWKLISITPYSEIVKEIVKMKHKTYLLVLCFIIGSIALSLYFSRKLYLPMRLVIQNYNVFERNDFHYKKQEFLRKMVVSDDSVSIESFQTQFTKYHIALKPSDSFLAVLIKIDDYAEFCAKYNMTDRSLLKYGVINIVSELLSGVYAHECINMDEDQILVLISSAALPSDHEQLTGSFRKIQEHVSQYLNLSISVTFSERFETLSGLRHHYLKTLDLSFYRLVFGHQSLIFNENLPVHTDDFKFPQDQDKKMSDALIQGQLNDAKAALSAIIQYASKHSLTILNSVLIRLLLSIRHAIEVLEANHSINVNFNFNIYLAKVQKIETLEQIQSDFMDLFEKLSIELESKKDNKYIKLLDEVTSIIQKEYANPALSLVTIAEQVNLSPSYLGKLFKKHRLISITDFINGIRLSSARDRIASSDEAINTIMESCGFLSRSHFFTLFKKVYGVTPVQYRSNAKLLKGDEIG